MPVGPGLVGAAILIVGLFVIGRVVAKWLGPAAEVPPKKKSDFARLIVAGLLVVMIGVPFFFRAVPVGDTLLRSDMTLAAVLLDSAFATLVVALGFAGAWAGLKPFRTTRTVLKGELHRRFLLTVVYLIGLTLLVAVVIELGFVYSVWPPVYLFGALLVAVGGVFLVSWLTYPVQSPYVAFGIRRPTADERDRIEAIYERLDIPLPDSIEVAVNDYDRYIVVFGDGDRRVLALSDNVFSAHDSDIQSVKIALAEGRARHGVDSLYTKHQLSLFGALFSFISGTFIYVWEPSVSGWLSWVLPYGPFLLAIIFFLSIARVLAWGEDKILLADEYTIEHAGQSLVADVYGGPEKRDTIAYNAQAETDGNKLPFGIPIADRLKHLGLGDGSDEPSNSGRTNPDSTA